MTVDISRELIDDCVHCGFCLPTCPTYGPLWQEEMDSPRGRILLMSGLVDGTVELSATTVQHFDRCLGCMACLTSCPSGVRYDRLIEQTRAHVEEHHQRSDDERLLRALVFATVPYPRRLRLALALTPPRLPGPLAPFAALRPPWRSARRIPELTPAVGERRLRVGLLLGCVQRVVFGDVNAATARVLAAEGCEVVAPGSQGCCGALHLHAGRVEEGRRRARRIAETLGGVDVVVVNAAGCGSHLKEADLPVRVVDVNELLAELEPRAERHELPIRVAYQDACHLGHAQGIRDAPREVLALDPGARAGRAGRAGDLLRQRGYLQPRPAGAGGRAGRAEGGERRRRRARRSTRARTPAAWCRSRCTCGGRAGRMPALHPVELLDASIRGVGRERLLASARR